MSQNDRIKLATVIVVATMLLICTCKEGASQTVQLPTVRTFGVRTAVSVPDGGRIRLGGVGRHSSGRISRGAPLVGPIPGVGRFFGNRGIGSDASAGYSTVHPRLIIMSELEAEVLARADRLRRSSAARAPNGTVAVQKKADFISRNIGRTNRNASRR